MFQIESLIKAMLNDTSVSTKYSIACISTTNPVYLVFSSNSPFPEFVVRRADADTSKQDYQLNKCLYEATGGLVPEPIGLYEHGGHVFSVEKGVQGRPWFQLAGTVRTVGEWENIRKAALETLHQFHAGVARVSQWTSEVQPGKLLRSAYKEFCNFQGHRDHALADAVDSYLPELDSLGCWTGVWQHGDFSLNNLLFEESSVTVVDLEDFGITTLPLYDEFTLALSLNTLAPSRVSSSLAVELGICTGSIKHQCSFRRRTVQALFLCHLLIRLGSWSSAEKRQPYRQKLLRLLEDYVKDPDAFINR